MSQFTLIAAGTIVLPSDRTRGPAVIQFRNTTAYTSYLIVFPTVRDASATFHTQVAEVRLSQGMTPPHGVPMADARGGQFVGGTFTFGAFGRDNPGTYWNFEPVEGPDQAIDGATDTKYLIFRNTGAGLVVSPQAGPSRVNQMTFWTANDGAERDPVSYEVYGFATKATARTGTLDVATGGTLLGSGTLALPAARLAGPVTVTFANSTAYASYLVVFPTVKNSPATTMTQVSELQFGYNGVPEFTLPAGVTTPVGVTWTARDESRNWQGGIASSADGTKLAAAVYGGQIYTSTDSGATWTARETARNWRCIASSANGTKLAACVVGGGQIYTSTDSGVTWTARATNRSWYSIASSADGTKLAAVANGSQIYTSTDSGVTWVARESNRGWMSIASSADGSKLAAVDGDWGGKIYTSTDSGVTWTARDVTGLWRCITSSADGNKLAAVQSGAIYTSNDGGVTWTNRPTGVGAIGTLLSITTSTDGSTLAAGGYDTQIYISTDSGVTWTAREGSRIWTSIALSAGGTKLTAAGLNTQIHTSSAVTAPYHLSVLEDSGSFTQASFGTGITPGVGDVGQTVSFGVATGSGELFSTLPAISADGTLTFTPAANANGTSSVTVIASDSTGLSSAPQTFTIEITPVIDPPVLAATPTSASIATTSATLGGEVLFSESAVTERGIVVAPTSADPLPSVGSAGVLRFSADGTVGDFTVNAAGLVAGTAYSFRAYAINSAGTRYSDPGTFTTVRGAAQLVLVVGTGFNKVASIGFSKLQARATPLAGQAVSVASADPVTTAGGTVVISGSNLRYTPAVGYAGNDSFEVVFNQLGGGTFIGRVDVTVSGASGGRIGNAPQIMPAAGGGMQVRFRGIPGVTYRIQRSTDLQNWQDIETAVGGDAGEIQYVDPAPPSPSGFYRLVQP